MSPRPLTAAVLLALGLASSPAVAGQKVTTPLLRIADPAGKAHGSVQLKVKGDGSVVTIKVSKLAADVATPLGIFLEEAPASGTFTEVATIDALANGAGKIILSAADGAPDELGVATLDDLDGRLLQVRDANDAPQLDALLHGLTPFTGTKLTAKLVPPEGAPAPAASAKLTGKCSNAKGTERFSLKAKKLPAGITATVFIEDAPGSGNFLPAGDLDGSLYLRDTNLGDRLPLEVATHAELVDRAIQVRDGDTVLLAGTIQVKGKPSLFPLETVIILDGLVDDRYLRVVGIGGVLYRTKVDLSQTSIKDLADSGEALWRLDKIGESADGPIVTVTLVGHENTWWMVSQTGSDHYVWVQNQTADPADFEYAHFILHMGPDVGGKPSCIIESQFYAGEYLEDQGHTLTANGVKLGPQAATFVLH